jgi:hypothetical protein
MRSLPTWANARTLDGICGFGEELLIARKVAQSLRFYFEKYNGSSQFRTEDAALIATLQQSYAQQFDRECLRLFGIADPESDQPAAVAIVKAVKAYYHLQQRHRVNYKHDPCATKHWLADAVIRRSDRAAISNSADVEMMVVTQISEALESLSTSRSASKNACTLGWATAVRLLMPREGLYREALQKRIADVLGETQTSFETRRSLVSRLIRSAVGRGRRHWRSLPAHMIVRSHVTYEGSSVIDCFDTLSNIDVTWCEGLCVDGVPWLLGRPLVDKHLRGERVKLDGASWSGVFPGNSSDLLSAAEGREEVDLSSIRFHYAL